jgi:hypothetical protein
MYKFQIVFNYATKFRLNALVMVLASIMMISQIATAQGNRGTISGTVTDPSGAVVPNATVKLVDVAKGKEVRTIQTDSSGNYRMIEIDPSIYNLVISAPNFTEFQKVNIKVEPNRNLSINAALTVGGSTNVVSVSAGEELIDRESATLGTTVDNKRIEGLPLNGRNVLGLALLQPGVAPASSGFGSGLGIRVNGSRGVENNITLDGGNNNEVAVGGAIGGQPRPDAVQEFRLLTSNFEAEFGRNTGAVINFVTRSGTNQYHGNGRFFYRPTNLSAARFLDKALPPPGTAPGTDLRRKFERKEYGFNIGGPIYFLNPGSGGPLIYDGKDRSFFFVDFERRWQTVGATATVSGLPTAAERGGDFSASISGRTCQDGNFGICDPVTGNQYPGNIIPASNFSPIANYYLGFIPTGDASGQAQVSEAALTINNFLTMRFDHSFNENHLLNFTFNYTDTDAASPFAFGGSAVPGFGSADRRKTRAHVARYTWVVNSTMVNSLLINISKNKQPGVAPVNTTTPAEIGFTADFVANAEFAGPPVIRFFDRGFQLGNTIQGPQRRISENYQIQDSFSWITGPHRLKFGVDATKYKQGQDFLFVNQGLFTFSGLFGNNTTGDDFADLLIGNSPVAAQYGAAGRRDFRQLAFAGFAQDNWNAFNGLTLSMGVRYEYTSPLKDLEDRVAFYRPGSTSTQLAAGSLNFEGRRIVAGGALPNGLVYVGDPDNVLGGTVPRGGSAPDKNNFAPRLGFAYSFQGNRDGFLGKLLGENQTVIRGAFGVYYGAIIGDNALQQLTATGYNGTNAFFFPNGGTLANPFAPDPYPGFDGVQPTRANPFTSTANIVVPSVLNAAATPIDPLLKTPYTLQWNLTLERAFANDYVFGVSYVGNRGKKQYVTEQINPSLGTFLPAPVGFPAPTTGNTNARRLNPSYAIGLGLLTAAGTSAYDSLQLNFQKRFSPNGLQYQVAYTWSKSINDSDTQRGNIDILDRSAGRGLSNDDVPHRFVASFVYELPFFKNTKGFLNRLVDGWGINGIYNYQSGAVFSVLNPNDTVGTGGGLITFADLGNTYTQQNPQENDRQAFNADAFASFSCGANFNNFAVCGPNGFRRGTAGRNQFRLNNPTNNFDLALIKKTRLFNERNILELRLEAFNALNKTQFTTVDNNLSSASFGKYTQTLEARVIQLGARLSF